MPSTTIDLPPELDRAALAPALADLDYGCILDQTILDIVESADAPRHLRSGLQELPPTS